MSLKKLSLTAFVSIVGVLSASCFFSSPSALSVVTDATSRALDSGSVHFELSTSVEGDITTADAEEFSVNATGGFDDKAGRSLFVLEAQDLGLEIRQVDDFVYVRLSGEEGWTKFDADEFEEIGEILAPLFDPYALLKELGIDPSSAKHEGSDEIRGKQAERYRLEVPARDYDQTLESLFPVERDAKIWLWIGENGLPARLIIESNNADLGNGGDVLVRLTLDLFDYGKPVDVEAPPPDQIAELPDFGDIVGGAYEDPFEGADCYGERAAECLAVNPEAEAIAQDPALCQLWDVRVCLVPMGFVRADVLKAIVDFHKTTKGIDVVVLPGIPLPNDILDVENSQLPTLKLDELMKATYITTGTASTFIGISGIDQQGESFGWWFGHRFGRSAFSNQHGMFSYFRMANVAPYSGDPITDDLLHLRASKYAARYTALLLLDYPMTEDPDYLNYYEMYGFSDLDSMGTKWPEDPPPCLSGERVVCVVSDGIHEDPAFAEAIVDAAERITVETGVRVEVRVDALSIKFAPSKPDWGAEYVQDISTYVRGWYHYPQFPIVGVTDDALAQDASVTQKIDEPHPSLNLSVVSAHGAGKPGTTAYQERLYRLILRGVLVAQFQMELNDDSGSLLYRGITAPEQLDGKTIPALPR